MIRAALAVLALLASLWINFGGLQAQALDEAAFWRLLEQTARALEDDDPSPATLDPIRQQWTAVDAVSIDGLQQAVDLNWIQDALASGDASQESQLLRYSRALLDYHAQHGNKPPDGGASLAALERVLSEARFQYAQITPTPLPTAAPQAPESEASSAAEPSLPSQIILIGAGVVAVIFVLVYAARLINVQPMALAPAAADEPATFDEARQAAENHEAERDYRAAVRYLYLSSLLLLDEHNVIRYDPSLTNREHLRQIAGKPPLFDALRQVINVFEDVWYGFRPIDAAFYKQYRQRVEQLRQLVP